MKLPKLTKKQWLIRLALVVLTGIMGFLALVLLVYFEAFGEVPDVADLKEIKQAEATEVYTKDGKLIGKYFIENRDIANAEDIPQHLVDALIATEDVRFMNHNGIDYRALGRVIFKTILLGDEGSGGGSTISQQLIKNLFPRQYRGFLSVPVAKIKESIAATRLEETYTKREIIWLYLNTVPFGEDVYGIETAAERYFSKPIQDLNLQESATLVGMLKGPNGYHPIRYPEKSKQRRNTVLAQMVRYEFLSDTLADSVQTLPLEVKYQKVDRFTGMAPYLRERARLWLGKWCDEHFKENGQKYNPYTDGLKLYLSIDSRAQAALEASVNAHIPKLQERFEKEWGNRGPWLRESFVEKEIQKGRRYQVMSNKGLSHAEILEALKEPVSMTLMLEGNYVDTLLSPLDSLAWRWRQIHPASISLNPHTGAVLAWVGGKDFSAYPYDHVLAERQVGSLFKPFVYLNALEQDAQPCDFYEIEEQVYEDYDGWTPSNSGGPDTGYYSLAGALANSSNTVTAKIAVEFGLPSLVNLAKSRGFSGSLPLNPSISLGSASASPLQMAVVYSSFVNEGKIVSPWYIDRLESVDGKLLHQEKPEIKPVPNYDTTAQSILNQMLKGVVDSGTARSLRGTFGYSLPIGGKTGTTQNNADAWFAALQENLVTITWVGASSPLIHFRYTQTGQGASAALPIAGRYLQGLSRSKEYRAQFSQEISPLSPTIECPHYLSEAPKRELFKSWFSWFYGKEDTLRDSLSEDTGGRFLEKVKGWFRKED